MAEVQIQVVHFRYLILIFPSFLWIRLIKEVNYPQTWNRFGKAEVRVWDDVTALHPSCMFASLALHVEHAVDLAFWSSFLLAYCFFNFFSPQVSKFSADLVSRRWGAGVLDSDHCRWYMSACSLTTQILGVPSQWWPAAYWPPQVVASYHPEVNWIPHWPFLCPKNIHLFYFWPPSSAQCFGGRKWLKAPLLGNPSTLAGAGRALRCFPEQWGAWELDDFNNTREVESKLKAGGVVPCRTNSIWRVKNVHGGHQPAWSSVSDMKVKAEQNPPLSVLYPHFLKHEGEEPVQTRLCYPAN